MKSPSANSTVQSSDTIVDTFPNATVAIDCAGPLPRTKSGNVYIVVLQDSFTKYTELISTVDLKASTISEIILHTWICRYGPMKRLLSDNGSEFSNKLLSLICTTLAVKKIRTTPMHPQSNGMVERMMQTIKKLLASQAHVYASDWDLYLPRVQLIYNSSVHQTTKESPFFLWFARTPPSFQNLVDDLDVPDPALPLNIIRFKNQLIHHLVYTTTQLAVHLAQQPPQPLPSVEEVFAVGDLVWLEDKTQSTKAQSKKLVNIWTGPFLILEIFANRNVKLLCQQLGKPRFELRVSFDRIRHYTLPLYMPWIQPGKPFKFPQFIVAKKIYHNEIFYKIQWLSHSALPDSWEAVDKIPPQLVFNFNNDY